MMNLNKVPVYGFRGSGLSGVPGVTANFKLEGLTLNQKLFTKFFPVFVAIILD